jgi:4-hydroxy-tetrahydrodipicolinate synthase
MSYQGVWTALITPFNAKGEIDFASYDRILADQKAAGVAGVIPCGTTGESPTLKLDEKQRLISRAIEFFKGSQVRVIAGTGSNSTEETVALSRWASEQGVAGVLVVTPYYNKPTQAGLEAHFRAVADAVSCEVMLYNVPGRTGVSIAASTVASLASHPKIRSIKEATGTAALTGEILDACSKAGRSIQVLSGDDASYLGLLASGAVGVVSVTSNLFPRGMVAIHKAFESGNVKEATKLQARYFPLMRDLFIESNPGPVKYAMAQMGWCENRLRLPLVAVSQATETQVKASLSACGIRKGEGA